MESDRSDRASRVERARRGDAGSFEELLSRYQQMAFAYALSLLRDYYLAQDAMQEALFIAYLNLGNLKDPVAFPGWLRGIVHHQCCRYLRRRHVDLAPLDEAIGVPEAAIGPEQYLERREAVDHITAAIAALPPAQREVSILYYVKDYSQREIAAFLGLPVSTVNNRLHAARRHLKGALRPMADNITTSAPAGRDTATVPNASGTVIADNGPVLDARFAPEVLPPLMAALTAGGQAAQVVQRLDTTTVRCIISDQSGTVTPGTSIGYTGRAIDAPLGAGVLEQALPLLGNPHDGRGAGEAPAGAAAQRRRAVLETGIKVIDLLCPFVGGDKVGFAGQPGSGKLVLTMELSRNLARGTAGLSFVTFMSVRDVSLVYDGKEEIPQGTEALQVIYLATPNPTDPTDPASLAAARALDAMVYTSGALTTLGIYPSVDPLLSSSRNLDRAIVGDEHYEVAQGVKGLLRHYREIQEGAAATGATLSDEDRQVVARARRAQRLFTQPFAVAEPFTGRPGVRVSLPDTIRSFKRLLAGDYDEQPEDSFMWRGAME